jgi:hypothetical protein
VPLSGVQYSAPHENLIETEDFKKPDNIGIFLQDIYKKGFDLLTEKNVTNKKTFLSPANNDFLNLNKELEKISGFTSLPNRTGNCAINSSLQLLRTVLQGIAEHDPVAWNGLSSKIEQERPYLLKFVNNEINTEGDAQELRKEAARVLTEDFWYSHFSGHGIAQDSLEKGNFYGAFVNSALAVLLHRLQVPPVVFNQTAEVDKKEEVSYHAWQVLTLDHNDQIASSSNSINDLLNNRLNRESRKLGDPVPTMLCINCTKCDVSNVLEPITLPHQNGTSVIYEPKSINCSVYSSYGGHAFAIIKKEAEYYEVNDSGISSIPTEWEDSLKTYCDKNATIIIYEQKSTEKKQSNQKVNRTPPEIDKILHKKEESFLKAEQAKRLAAKKK